MSNVSFLRNITYAKPDSFIHSVPVIDKPEQKAAKQTDKKENNEACELKQSLSHVKKINEFLEFSKLKDISSQFNYKNPRLYKDFVDSYIPKFFLLSEENQLLLKDDLVSMLEDFIPVKHLDIDENDSIQIEHALADSLKRYSSKSAIDEDELLLSRFKKIIDLKGIEKFPLLTIFVTKLALESAVNLLVKNYNILKNIEGDNENAEYLKLKNSIEKDLLFRNAADFINKLNQLDFSKYKSSEQSQYLIAKNEKSINESLTNFKLYAEDREDFLDLLKVRKHQIKLYLEGDLLSFKDKELLLSSELFPEISLEFNPDLEFNLNDFSKNPSSYIKKYLNILESMSNTDDLSMEKLIFNSIKQIYAKSHLFLDKDTRLRFFGALFNNTPHITENLVNKTNYDEKDYQFFSLFTKNIFNDYLKTKDQNDILMAKNLISIFSHSPDKDLQGLVFNLSDKLVNNDLHSSPGLQNSFKTFFQALLANEYEETVIDFFSNLILKIN